MYCFQRKLNALQMFFYNFVSNVPLLQKSPGFESQPGTASSSLPQSQKHAEVRLTHFSNLPLHLSIYSILLFVQSVCVCPGYNLHLTH